MNQSKNKNQPSEPQDIWVAFLAEEQQSNFKLGKIFVEAGFAGYEFKSQVLPIYFSDEDKVKTAKSTLEKLKKSFKTKDFFVKLSSFKSESFVISVNRLPLHWVPSKKEGIRCKL